MLYNAENELYEWKIHKQLKESYGWEDDTKEWLATVKVHHKKWKKIKHSKPGKQLAAGVEEEAAGRSCSFRGSTWPTSKATGWPWAAFGRRAKRRSTSIWSTSSKTTIHAAGTSPETSEVYKCRKYIADVPDHERIYVRVVEIAEGTVYKIEQGYPVGHGDDDEDEDGGSGGHSGVASENEELEAAQMALRRTKKAAGAPAPAPAAPDPTEPKKRRKKAA
jgi:hypothetical protein